jgi:peptidoglycan hydrolase-like protein with peptidoglycan-binding domain
MTRAATFKAEVLLDRLDISPGIIDGKTGENVGKAITAFQRSCNLPASGKLDRSTWDKLCDSASPPALVTYTITDDDVRGPFVPEIPREFEGVARLASLGYRSAAELLAEKFHTSEDLIRLSSPGPATSPVIVTGAAAARSAA